MKSLKKFTAIVIAFILTFSVLTVVSSAADANIAKAAEAPSYNAEDLTYTPTMELEPSRDLGDLIDKAFGDDFLDGMAEGSKQGVAAGFDLSNFFRKVMAAIIELFDYINNAIFGK